MNETVKNEINYYLSRKNIYYNNFSAEFVSYLDEQFPTLTSIKAKWYMVKNHLTTVPLCKYKGCKEPATWNDSKCIFLDGCCPDHNKRLTSLKNYGTEWPNQNKKQVEKLKKSVLDKYGVKSTLLIPESKEKTKETNLTRYGTEEAGASEIVRARSKKTNLERYGTEEVFASKEIREKSKRTMLKKFGVENSLASPEVRAKGYKTNADKYGSIYPMRNEELLERRRQTIIEKYDAYGVLGDPEIADKVRKTHWKKFYDRLMDNKLIKPGFTFEEYAGGKGKKYMWICKTCSTEFRDRIGDGYIPRCPVCFPKHDTVSNAEKILFENIRVENKIQSNRNLIEDFEIDIYLPDYKIGIEYNGVYWHSEQKGIDKYYHLNKTLLSENEGIFLIHIFETEWVNRGIQVISLIERHLGIFDDIISIEFLKVDEITKEETDKFIEENTLDWSHIGFEKCHGLFREKELVAIMTVKTQKDKHVVTNFYEKMGIGFEGSVFKKLLDSFELSKQPIYYYPDRRLNSFDDKRLTSIGFTFEGGTDPELWYSENKNGKKLISANSINRQCIIDYVSYTEGLTIHENMLTGGFFSIWDCGKLVFKLIRT